MSLASLNDAIAQFSALIGRLSSSSNNAAANMRGGPAFEAHLQRAMQLSFAETWTCLRQLQLWLSSFPAEGCAAAMIKMVELSVPFQGHQAPPTLQHVYQLLKENDPAKRRDSLSQRSVLGEDDDDALENANSFDASGWLDKAYAEVIEDKDADTVELFLFKTACLILRQMSTQSGLHLLAPQVVVFYFESIEKGSTLYVQRCAALACSIISKAHLPVLVSQFFDKQMTIVEKKFRWLLYQQATQMFAFGVATQEQAEVTVRYLESISKKMAKIDRGKLRGAICTSLEKVFGSIMGAHSPEAQAEWRNFTARFGMLSKQFSDAFVSIYTTVVKWAKKSKHALPCWRLMVRMTSVGSVQFYTDKKREPILPLLLKGAAKFRLECLSYICDLYSSLPAELARADMEGFTADCKKVLALCFPKKKDPEPEERPLFFGIITSIGKINPHLAFTELQSLLGSKDTSIIAKGVLCQSLGSVAREFPREVSGYNNYFGPLLLQFMTDQDQFLAGNAIRSFPFVTVPDPQKEKLILEYVTRVVVSTESKEMSDTAFKSLCSYLVLEPDVNLVPLAVIFLNILGNRTFSKGNHQDYSKLFPAFKYLRRLIHLYLSILEKDGKATGITASQWLPVRMQAEGLTLMWLTHTEYEVRKLALSLLAAFSEPVFDELENAKSKAPKESRLVYILQALPQDSPNEKWSPVLVGLFDAVRGTDVLRPPLEYAWIRLFVRFEGSISALHALDLEKLQLWLNMVRFLMCSLAYPEVKDESESQNAVMNNKVSPGAMNQAFVLLLRVAWQPPSNMQELRSILLSYMGMLHPSCIEQAVHVVKHIRMQSVMDKGEKKMKGKEKAKWEEEARRAENSWCFHHDVLELLSRFVIQLNDQFDPAKSAGKPSLPTFLAQTLHRCVYAWMKDFEQNGNQNIGHRLSPVIRCYGMRMMRVFLDPSSGFTERPQANLLLSIMQAWTPAPRALYLHAAYRQIPRHLERYADDKDPKESSSEERDRKLLEIAVVNAVERLLKLGPLAASGGEGLPKQALSFLQSMALRGPHLRQHVEAALEAFLKHQPNFKNIFFKHSVVDVIYDELCLTNEAAVLLAAIMLSALVRNWCADISLWYSVHQVSQPQMLMVSLLHQCSPDPTCRSLGGKLAAALETHPALALEADASSLIATTEFGGLSLCVAATYKYSRLLATKYATQIGGPLLQEVVAAAQLLPDVQNESMLQLMLPWIEHFGDDDTSEEQWVRFIDHLLQMSYQCHTRANSSFLFFTLELCWQAVLANKSVPQLASWTISFLVTQHANNAMLPQLDEHMSDEAKAKQEAKQIYQHLCLRIVLFIATASNVNNLCDLLRLEMPDHSSVPDEPNAHNVQELTSWFATEKLHTDIADERQISAFLLSSELFIAHAHTLQRDQLPRLLQLACVHFGPNAPAHMRHGSELLSRVLAALSALRKDEREPLHEPPTDAAGRAKLIEALCCCDGGDELRQQWAAQALKWAFLALDSREAIDSIEWYSSLVGGSLLPYQVLYRIVVFLCACLEQEREEEAAALLTMLRDHVLALDSLPYDVGALLAAPALLVLNSNVRLHFGLGQSMLRALLERSLNLGRRELLIGAALDAHESNGGAAFASTTWKASLLHPALTAQLDIIGASPSIDKALRMLLLRGASLAEFADDSAWLLADLRALYDGLLPECDQLSLSILWIMMLRACTYPRTPEGDHACDIADRFLQARGSYFDNLRPIFFALHSSAGSRQYAMSLDGSDPVGAGTAEEALRSKKADFWLEPLSDFLSNLKLLYSTIDDQQRSFEVLLDATCLWLLLCKDVEGGTDADTVHRWVILNMLEKLLSEFRGIWSEAQHAATANLLSSWVFRLNSDVHDVHASKIRMCMQHLVSDPPPDSMDEPLVFIQRGAGTETGVSLAAICAAAASKGHFANDFFFLPSIPAQEWLAHLTACTAQLAPVQYDDSMPKVHIDLERVPPPRQSPLPVTGGQMREFLTPQPIRGFMAPTSFLAAPSGALPPPPMLGSIAALPPPPLLGQSRPSSTSIELPPPPLNMSSMGTSGVLPPPFGGVGAMPPPLGGMSSIPPPLPSSMPPPPLASGNSSVSVLPPPPFLGGGAPETPLPMPNFPPGMPPPPGRDGRSESGVLMGGLGAPPQLPSRGPSISNARFSSPSLPPPLPSLLSAGAPESVSFPPPPPPLSSNLGSALPPPPNLFGSKLPPPPNLFGSAAPQQANLHSGVQATHPYSDPPVVDCRPREDSTKVSEYI